MWFMIGAVLVGVAVIVAIAVNSINSNSNENRAMLARNQQMILDRLDLSNSRAKQVLDWMESLDKEVSESGDGEDNYKLIKNVLTEMVVYLDKLNNTTSNLHTMAMQNIAVSVAHARLAGYGISDCEDFPHRVMMNGKPVNVYDLIANEAEG